MAASQKVSMQSKAYEFIKQKITACEYAPNQMLSEAQLQEELGFSRTPVREAIGRLEQEGLLRVFPKRGIVVSDFSIRDVSMIFEVRRLIEPYALRNYGNNLDPDRVQEFYDAFEHANLSDNFEQFYELDDRFHALLLTALPNTYLTDLYARIQTQNMRLRVLSGQFINDRLQAGTEEHLAIAEACLERNWERAAIAMSKHLQNSEKSSLAIILKNQYYTSASIL